MMKENATIKLQTHLRAYDLVCCQPIDLHLYESRA